MILILICFHFCCLDWTPIDIQLSPKKALRAAMLKSRFADTIFKAKHKTLLDHVMSSYIDFAKVVGWKLYGVE